jgi:Bax protein
MLKPTTLIILAILLGSMCLSGCRREEPTSWTPPARLTSRHERPPVLRPDSHQDLESYFADKDYDWETLGKGVPPFIIKTLPSDLHRVRRTAERKRIFFLSLLPMVLIANDEVAEQRRTLQGIFRAHDEGLDLTDQQLDRLGAIQKEYEVRGDPLNNRHARRDLLRRVDIIPASLVLAQAATESAYGTSRFARRANNLFGEWTFIPGTGLIPKNRPEGASYEVRRFDSIYDSLHSYLNNINTHPAYQAFRAKRAALRAMGRPLRGVELAGGLELYSTRRQAYVRELRSIIRHNRLSLLSDMTLRNRERPLQPEPLREDGLRTVQHLSSRRLQMGRGETTAD